MSPQEAVAVPVVVGTMAGTVGWVIATLARNIRQARTAKLAAELHSKLLDKFGTGPELLAYVESEGGRKILDLGAEPANVFQRILGSIQTGIVLAMAGLGLWASRLAVVDGELRGGLTFLSIPMGAVGIGFLLSGAISYLLSKSWGLLDTAAKK